MTYGHNGFLEVFKKKKRKRKRVRIVGDWEVQGKRGHQRGGCYSDAGEKRQWKWREVLESSHV